MKNARETINSSWIPQEKMLSELEDKVITYKMKHKEKKDPK